MRFGILGSLAIHTDDGVPVDPGGPRPRALLTLLLLDAGRPVPVRRLIDGVYGDEPPAGAAGALQSQISRLRRRLAPHAQIEGTPVGYRVVTPPESVDSHTFERLCAEGRAALTAGDPARAAARLREALDLWRGPALPDLPGAPAEAARLTELRLAAVQDRIEADLALGGGPDLVPELRAMPSAHPLSERLYGQLMRALHTAGRPAEALTVYEEARRTLAEQLGTDPSPELSGMHQELLRGRAAPPRRARLPAQLTRFVGRAAELARIATEFEGSRLVTLTGPGGTGKTRLAIEAAGTGGTGADVCFVELAPLTDGTQIPYAVLTALGVRDGFRGAAGDITDRLLTALEHREVLLVLDNCEHLVEDAARTAALLLGACPGVSVLATSREALGITGEVLVPVPPLPPEPAVRLFVDRARAVRPGFEGHARVADICAALDGLPLAIELAAARLRTLDPDELADRLDDRFRLLSRGDRSKAPRHRTLRAVVEWSWELLDDDERELARRLTVFNGGATLDAVEAVCGVPRPEELLASLVEKSFLEFPAYPDPPAHPGALPAARAEGRYRMLETIRAFAAEELTGGDRLRDAHAGYFLELAERAEPHLRTGGQLPWLARLTAEQGNLGAAQRHLTRTDPGVALRLMAALTWFRRLRGLHGEQLPQARALLAAVGDEPPEGLAEEYALCAMNTIAGREDDPAEPDRIARVTAVMESLDHALRLPFTVVEWSLACGPRLGAAGRARVQVGTEPWGLALLDMGVGYQELFAGRAADAEAAFTRSLAGFRATGDRWGMANCLDALGGFAGRHGEYARALRLLDEGLAHVRELEAPEETADLLRTRATVLLHRGDAEEAARHFTRSAALARTAGAGDKVASALRGLGDVARLSGDTARARVRYEKALQRCAANWFSVGETVRILVGLGRTAAAEGDAQAAGDRLAQARALALDSPDVLALADVADALAALAPDPERAAGLLGAATGLRGAPSPGDLDVVRTERDVRARLVPEAYDRAFERGRRLKSAAVGER
ncbi:SARP family transcriptional regulator [Streptomyces viridiviolaceus]|uniref:BTAD domain-containing putative transcriptional regulator n=1 Tax=Streptomyces viridiviolaceus TaxID=68282 RepID=A0ABW2EDB7_9ACTN|nr:BTAD domain-containing putative transcriptional regulator [Streptomyces viridiviolaceus]GHB65150.1 SARP family transcriptional regulator [Streptomyces viridiviolaceus]